MERRSRQPRQAGALILHEKLIDETGGITEFRIWQVPKSTEYPEGIRYSCAYVPPGEDQPAVLYDVHRGKLHHRHVEGIEDPYRFTTVRQLLEDFRADVDRIKTARGRAQS